MLSYLMFCSSLVQSLVSSLAPDGVAAAGGGPHAPRKFHEPGNTTCITPISTTMIIVSITRHYYCLNYQ